MNEDQSEIQYETGNPFYFVVGILLGSLLGALAGATVMLLLAPQSGEKTRRLIRRKSRDVRDQTTETVEDGVRRVRRSAYRVTTDLHDHAEDLQQRGQELVDEQKERWSPVVKAGKTAVNGT